MWEEVPQRRHRHRHASATQMTAALLTLLGAVTAGACVDAASCTVTQQQNATSPAPSCPCKSPELCQPIRQRHRREVGEEIASPPGCIVRHIQRMSRSTRENQRAVAYLHGAQVFGFSVRQADQYAHYDWDQLTTVAWNTDPALMCMVRPAHCYPTLAGPRTNAGRHSLIKHRLRAVHRQAVTLPLLVCFGRVSRTFLGCITQAHSKGARVVLNAGVGDARWLTNDTARTQWVSASTRPHSRPSALPGHCMAKQGTHGAQAEVVECRLLAHSQRQQSPSWMVSTSISRCRCR